MHFGLQIKLVLLLTFYYFIQMFLGYFNYFDFLKIVLLLSYVGIYFISLDIFYL